MNTILDNFNQSVNILAFDTSRDEASVALYSFGKMQSFSLPIGTGPHSQAACLVPALQKLLEDAGITFQEVHVIATPTGPGSFTGLRLGIATAQGLLLATNAECYTPTTFQMVAFDAWKKQQGLQSHSKLHSLDSYLITLTTKRSSYYVQAFDGALAPIIAPAIFEPEDIQEFLTQHPKMKQVDQTTDVGAENLIHLYFHEKDSGATLASSLHPFYLHDPEFVRQDT
ncbi:MAG: tRNA (adenosine(37)-N6)-threonylcarbamoyltransferase complex dimerization subunit type 1 TsaB [Alphaproteobacteria bacterium]|nr:tRNA (adenosine(37)-N6)-threonylcarbamoyltransferase complex dimerization subunit type 1 TsaB [Alphaproteobacteria bacterium]